MVMESVKKGFSLLFSSLNVVAVFFAFGAVTNVLNVQLAERLQTAGGPATGTNAPLVAGSIVVSVAILLMGIYFQAASMGYFRDKVKTGTSALSAFFNYGVKYYPTLLVFALIAGALVGLTVLAGVFAANLPAAARVPMMILLVVIGLATMVTIVLLFFGPYAAIVDGLPVAAAIKKSVAVVKKNLLGMVLIGLILIALGFITGFISGVIMGVFSGVTRQQGVSQSAVAVMSSLVNAFLGVLMTATFMTFYVKATQGQNSPSS